MTCEDSWPRVACSLNPSRGFRMTEKKPASTARKSSRKTSSSATPATPAAARSTAGLKAIQKTLEQTQEQISLLHGVLEELCERQEALASWQMEVSKRLVALSEAQWRVLEDIAGTDLGHPVERIFGNHEYPLKDYNEVDALDDADNFFDSVSKDLTEKRSFRRKKASQVTSHGKGGKTREGSEAQAQEVPESILVLPTKPDVH